MKRNHKDDSFDILKSELKKYRKNGIHLSLQGKPSNPYNIVKAHKVSEEKNTFMRDYITDDTGHVKEIDFQCVKSVKTE